MPVDKRSALRGCLATAMIVLAISANGCDDSGDNAQGVTDQLVGAWTPDEVPSVQFGSTFDPASARIMFHRNGDWTASDGCNNLSGTYTLDGGGQFSSESGSFAGIGCGGGQIPYDELLAQTDQVTFKDDGTALFESSTSAQILTLSPSS